MVVAAMVEEEMVNAEEKLYLNSSRVKYMYTLPGHDNEMNP